MGCIMSILWLIIRITLWILLGIFCALVFILLLILIAPIKYDCKYEKYEENYCQLRFSFLRFIKANLIFENDKQDTYIKVFGKVVYRYYTDDFEEVVEETALHVKENAEDLSKDVVTEESHARGESKAGTTKWRVIKDLIFDKRFFALLKDIWIVIKKILNWLKPYQFNFELIIGRENPADTGELIAQITLLYPWYYPYGVVLGNYEATGVWGNAYAKGKFHLMTLVKIIVIFISKKETRDYIHLILKTRKGA